MLAWEMTSISILRGRGLCFQLTNQTATVLMAALSAEAMTLIGHVKDHFENLLPFLLHRCLRDDIHETNIVTLTQLSAQVLCHADHIHPTVIT